MSTPKVFLATLSVAALLVATSVQGANFTVSDGEIWDGTENPHAADGVTLVTTGTGIGTDPFVSTYTVPFQMTVNAGATMFLRDYSTFTNNSGSDTDQNNRNIVFNFTGASNAGLIFSDAGSTIDLFKGVQSQPARTVTFNMNNNPIGGLVAGAGQMLSFNHLDSYTTDFPMQAVTDPPASRLSFGVTINSMNDVKVGTIDTTAAGSGLNPMNVIAHGTVDIDNLANGDITTSGNSAMPINITGGKLIIGNLNGQSVRTDLIIGQANVTLRALAQPANSASNFAGNTVANNSITLDGFFNLQNKTSAEGGRDDNTGGNLTLTAAQVTLADTFTYRSNASTLAPGNEGFFRVNTGEATGGFTQAQLFVNNSTDPDAQFDGAHPKNIVSYTVLHDNNAPPQATWATNTSGNWHTDANWTPAVAPNVNQTTVTFGSVITSPKTIFLNTGATVKGLVFDTTSAVAVGGIGMLTLEANTGSAAITVNQGSHIISPQITLLSNTTATAASGTKVDLNGVLNLNGRTLTIVGPGQVNINNSVTGLGSIAGSGSTLGFGGSTSIAGNLSSDGTLAIDIDGANSHDSISVLGNATLSGVLAVDAVDGFAPSPGQTFTVLTAGSLNAADLTLGGPDASLFNLISTSNSLVLQAAGSVPEPASAVLAALAALAMTAAGRRR